MITTHSGDMLEVIPRLVAEGVVCDACVTDPPYHLTATQKRFGAANSAPAQYGKDGAMSRLSGGFMGQQWDGGDIAFRPETWTTIATILRPGGFLLAFGGTRTYHRLACAIEDAGFVIQDTIAWLYGSGFPKRRDMLKPAFEPLVLAYKPGGKRTLQVDECRIATNGEDMGDPARFAKTHEHEGWDRPGHTIKHKITRCAGALNRAASLGRWPANVCHDGGEEVTEAFAAFGESKSRAGVRNNNNQGHEGWSSGTFRTGPLDSPHNDGGTAARFFYCAKADAQDRWGSRHPTVKPVELMKWLVTLVTPPGGLVLDPFAGTGTTGVAALATGRSAILIEREAQYLADIREHMAFYEGGGAHSVQAKNRNRNAYVHQGDLFAPASEPRRSTGDLGSGWDANFMQPYDPNLDALESYNVAVRACGERYRSGEPLGQFFLSPKDKP